MRFLALTLSLIAITANCDEDWIKPPDGFRWPSPAGHVGDWQVVPLQDLSPEINNLVGEDDIWTSANDPKSIRIQWIDLNDDGVPELFIENNFGGSGGPAFTIFTRDGKNFREIGGFQGGMSLAERHEGWYQLDCSARAGGGVMVRYLLRFEDGEYKDVRSETHDFINKKIEINEINK